MGGLRHWTQSQESRWSVTVQLVFQLHCGDVGSVTATAEPHLHPPVLVVSSCLWVQEHPGQPALIAKSRAIGAQCQLLIRLISLSFVPSSINLNCVPLLPIGVTTSPCSEGIYCT